MSAQISFNPQLQTNAAGSFNAEASGYIQGMALDDPAARFNLAGGTVSSSETVPMWGGLGICENVDGATGAPHKTLGSVLTRATSIGNTGTAGQLTGFSVFNQAHGMVTSPQSPVPLAGTGMQVNFYRLGSGIRIPVPCAAGLTSLQGSPVNQRVSWDFVNQELVPYTPAYSAATITGATWASTAGGETTFAVGTDLSAVLAAGSVIDVSGVVSTGGTGAGYNGNFVVVSVTSTTIVVYQPSASSPGTYSSGGTVAAGGGALPVKVLDFNIGNSMTVSYNATTGFATWNRSGNTALILLASFSA